VRANGAAKTGDAGPIAEETYKSPGEEIKESLQPEFLQESPDDTGPEMIKVGGQIIRLNKYKAGR
jgi:hypothetical protein